MNNKELPQEIVSEIRQAAIKRCGGDYEGGIKGIQKDLLIGAYTTGAEISHVYYNSIIEGKDKEIVELKTINAIDHEIKEQLMVELFNCEKDKAIRQEVTTELLAEEQAEIADKNRHIANLLTEKVANIFMIAHQKAEIERITELLKEQHKEYLKCQYSAHGMTLNDEIFEEAFEAYKKEHHL